jgi:hypothetical protein
LPEFMEERGGGDGVGGAGEEDRGQEEGRKDGAGAAEVSHLVE